MMYRGQAVVFRKCFASKVCVMSISVSKVLDAGKQNSFMLKIL